ncbi:hypothetical protein BDV95DRAFT_587152 [Massariosphaeria phaeospora]|uniref:LysM domain-containing protein n=1 Tax=Massariosphaeria phaeospora TaxID=100035 RepID=A0A7C8I185_9PLEO|nr:hypothetical protein BDV95DRAFT_587152 [Massariosphaeria phaeospora]
MGRWADQDSDEQRLPDGMHRVGYDADTQTYTFQDAEGRFYESEEGNRYGKLWPAGQARPQPSSTETAAVKSANRESIRMMLPFALLVLVFLFLMFKFINSGSADDTAAQVQCGDGAAAVQVQKGDSCWKIAEAHGLGVDELVALAGNKGRLVCEGLGIGEWVCVPE